MITAVLLPSYLYDCLPIATRKKLSQLVYKSNYRFSLIWGFSSQSLKRIFRVIQTFVQPGCYWINWLSQIGDPAWTRKLDEHLSNVQFAEWNFLKLDWIKHLGHKILG